MYLPKAFQVEEQAELHALMRRNSFAALVTQFEGAPFATHLPFVLDAERGPHGTLVSHMARANPQWKAFVSGEPALVIFQGPHTYITPSWYDPTVASVPTWNYAIVHAYGIPRVIDDAERLRLMLEQLVDTYEAHFEQPWQLNSPTNEYVQRMMKAIVGFEIEITKLEGKYKLSQNRPLADQQRVAEELAQSDDPERAGVAKLMRAVQQR